MDAGDLSLCDSIIKEVDGTPNFGRIGGNVASAVSIAIARAAADSRKIPLFKFISRTIIHSLYPPLGNIIVEALTAPGRPPTCKNI